MAGLRQGFEADGGHEAKGWQAKRFSGSGESSAVSQAVQASVVGKPNELAESAGESGDRGEAAESEVKSVPKSSVSKMDTGENSGYVCCGRVSGVSEIPRTLHWSKLTSWEASNEVAVAYGSNGNDDESMIVLDMPVGG